MDELLLDELYDVEESFRNTEEHGAEPKWWILKAALADKGNGIRLFSTRSQLEEILDEFEPLSDDEEEEEENDGGNNEYNTGTRVDASQLREWVIQVGTILESVSFRKLMLANRSMYRPLFYSTPLKAPTDTDTSSICAST